MGKGTPLILRPYQSEALNAIAGSFLKQSLAEKITRQLVVLPTGTGKTIVVAGLFQQKQLADWLATYPATHQKVLMLAHREELLDQAADKISRLNPGLVVEIEQGSREAGPLADVVVASVQTLAVRGHRRLGRLTPEQFRIIVVDEAHHSAARSYRSVLQHFGMLPPDDFMTEEEELDAVMEVLGRDQDDIPVHRKKSVQEALLKQRHRIATWDARFAPADRLLLGITATPKRGDNIGLECVFQDIVYSKNLRDMIEAKYLIPLRAIKVETRTNLDGVHTQAGDFDVSELCQAIDTPERNTLAFKGWMEHAYGRKTIAFTANVQHAQNLAEAFRKHGVNAQPISGTTPEHERRWLIQQLGDPTSDLMALMNCNILTEGTDIPAVSCILHARPTKSSLLYIQMTGRGSRLAHDKKDCLIIDIVDVTRRHSLITSPELFGLPPEFDSKGQALHEVAKKVEEIKRENPHLLLGDAKSLDEINMRVLEVNLWTGIATAEVKQYASLSWIKDSDDLYRLSYPSENPLGEQVEISQDILGHCEIKLKTGYRYQTLEKASDLRSAFRLAEQWLYQNRKRQVNVKRLDARWREDEASDGQLQFLRKLGCPINLSQPLTKGQASDLIDVWSKKAKSYSFRRKKAS